MAEIKETDSRNEKNYEFRRYIDKVHIPDRRDPNVFCNNDETMVKDGWEIIVKKGCSDVIINTAKDLQDYFLTSMNTSVLLKIRGDLLPDLKWNKRAIILATKDDLKEIGGDLSTGGSYRLICSKTQIIICGNDERGTAQGSYYLEDIMNLKEAPVVKHQDVVRKPVFSPRMVHSGWGMDQFPNTHLNAIAHYGFDAVILTIKGVDQTATGYQDINNLIDRAGSYGIDVYLYSNIKISKHPDDTDAEEYYEKIYGTLFNLYSRVKGIILVGESIEFPSKDENTTGKHIDSPDEYGLPATKPSPGWWPCNDYPQYVNLIKKVIRKHSTDADIIFWTYNWGWVPEKERTALIRLLPDDITVMVTFEMFEQIQRENITNVCVDYTISFEGPGRYFTTEAEAIHKRNMRLYTMSNTAGLTWDFGVIPYEPVPFQWVRRYDALLKANMDYNLTGLIEAHHYGWWPSFVCEMTKWAFWEPSTPAHETAFNLACRDFGIEGAPSVIKAWEEWSNAIRYYVPTNEDQYGPFRIGPSYPLVFHPNLSRSFLSKSVKLPAAWHALTGNGIFFTFYQPLDDPRQTPSACRIDVEIRSLEKMSELWQKGIDLLEAALKVVPEKKLFTGERMLNLGYFILNSVKTTIHVKQWWKLNMQLRLEAEREKIRQILDEMVKIAEEEIQNSENTIPIVEADSRLGWEPTMDYMTDTVHLQWKIEQVKRVITHEIPAYLESLSVQGYAY